MPTDAGTAAEIAEHDPDGAAPADRQSGTLAELLFAKLTEAILQGELPQGSKISEPLLSQRYGVSRGPLREALHRLQERRLITRTVNQSARVVEATPQLLDSVFAIREALEGLAAREAALRMSQEDRTALRDAVRRHEAELQSAVPPQPNALGSSDQDFHFLIARSTGNMLLIELLCFEFYPLLRLYRSHGGGAEPLRSRALVEHRRILEAIEDRDAEMAEMQMRRHIAAAHRRRSAVLGRLDATEAPT